MVTQITILLVLTTTIVSQGVTPRLSPNTVPLLLVCWYFLRQLLSFCLEMKIDFHDTWTSWCSQIYFILDSTHVAWRTKNLKYYKITVFEDFGATSSSFFMGFLLGGKKTTFLRSILPLTITQFPTLPLFLNDRRPWRRCHGSLLSSCWLATLQCQPSPRPPPAHAATCAPCPDLHWTAPPWKTNNGYKHWQMAIWHTWHITLQPGCGVSLTASSAVRL